LGHGNTFSARKWGVIFWLMIGRIVINPYPVPDYLLHSTASLSSKQSVKNAEKSGELLTIWIRSQTGWPL
jgi:hypothetical protein